MNEKKLGSSFESAELYKGAFNLNLARHFYEQYNPICWGIVAPVLQKNNISDLYQMDKFTLKMSFVLISAHLKDNIGLYCSNIIANLGGYYFTLFLAVSGLLSLFVLFRRTEVEVRSRNLALCFTLILTLSLANYALVALVEPVLRRYAAYTDTLLISILIIFVAEAFRKTRLCAASPEV